LTGIFGTAVVGRRVAGTAVGLSLALLATRDTFSIFCLADFGKNDNVAAGQKWTLTTTKMPPQGPTSLRAKRRPKMKV
jgi:hypothetical protein